MPRTSLAIVATGCVFFLASGCNRTAPAPRKVLTAPPAKDFLSGAGASFPAPLYEKWVEDYRTKKPGLQLSYLSVGSSEGVKRFLEGVVDFSGSDAAMTDEEIAQVDRGVQLIPTAAGSVVLAYNLPDVEDKVLQLSRKTYVDIFLGKIRKWNHESIKADNPDIALPDMPIVVVTREDGSGTTYAFTNHLSAISDEWRDQGPGVTRQAEWPMYTKFAPLNEGAAATVKETPGALGYIQYVMARNAGLPMAALQNKAGKFVAPGKESGFATLLAAPLPENLRRFFPDPDGDGSYPIVTYTWLVLYKQYDSPEKLERLKGLVHYCLTEGQKHNDPLGYIPLPEPVVNSALDSLAAIEVASSTDSESMTR